MNMNQQESSVGGGYVRYRALLHQKPEGIGLEGRGEGGGCKA